jgi:hypothetical protein
MDTIFRVTNDDLLRLSPRGAIEVFRDLLWAEARRLGIPLGYINGRRPK